jgi:hypothetical protein
MPKRMRPYGSAVDAESAGRARGRRRGEDDQLSDIASAMTVRDVAAAAASAVEALRELTAHGSERTSLEDVRAVIGSLERIGLGMPHLCEGLARVVVVQHEDRHLGTAPGQDLDFWVGEVVEALASAGRAADMMTAALNQARRTSDQLRPAP